MGKNYFYYFDTKRLCYNKIQSGFRGKCLKGLTYVSIVIVTAVLINLIFSPFLDMPEEKSLKLENKKLRQEYKKMENRFEQATMVLRDIESYDSTIYRTIFETEPRFEPYTSKNFSEAGNYSEISKMNNQEVVIKNDKKIDQIFHQIQKQQAIFHKVVRTLKKDQDIRAGLPAIQPVKNPNLKRTAAGWGWKIHPIYKIKKFHHGIDFTAPVGEEVFATANGTVKRVVENPHSREGNKIIIEHENGYETVYSHLNNFNVRRGQKVERGDVIGFVGSTGLSTAPHLHYEVRKDGEEVNPVYYFFKDLNVKEYREIIAIAATTGQSFD